MESVAVIFDMDRNGSYDYVAGVKPSYEPTETNYGSTADSYSGFGLYRWTGGNDWDATNPANWGDDGGASPASWITRPAHSPSPVTANPDIEFSIASWDTMVTDSTPWDFDFRAYIGAVGDAQGEDTVIGHAPEPGSLVLAGLAAAGLVLRRQRRPRVPLRLRV
jgi:hypothetical protein